MSNVPILQERQVQSVSRYGFLRHAANRRESNPLLRTRCRFLLQVIYYFLIYSHYANSLSVTTINKIIPQQVSVKYLIGLDNKPNWANHIKTKRKSLNIPHTYPKKSFSLKHVFKKQTLYLQTNHLSDNYVRYTTVTINCRLKILYSNSSILSVYKSTITYWNTLIRYSNYTLYIGI